MMLPSTHNFSRYTLVDTCCPLVWLFLSSIPGPPMRGLAILLLVSNVPFDQSSALPSKLLQHIACSQLTYSQFLSATGITSSVFSRQLALYACGHHVPGFSVCTFSTMYRSLAVILAERYWTMTNLTHWIGFNDCDFAVPYLGPRINL